MSHSDLVRSPAFTEKQEEFSDAVPVLADRCDVDAPLGDPDGGAGNDVEAPLAQEIRQDRVEFAPFLEGSDVIGKQKLHFGLLDLKK